MNRRDALSTVSILIGGSVIGADIFLKGCASDNKTGTNFFNSDQLSFLREVCETILPKTDTPGATDAKVAEFADIYVKDCYTADNQKIFTTGLQKIDDHCKEMCGKTFMECQPQQRLDCLNKIYKESLEYGKTKKETDPNHYFKLIKEVTLLGFFTSELGGTKVLRHIAVPVKYDGSAAYKQGEPAWLDY